MRIALFIVCSILLLSGLFTLTALSTTDWNIYHTAAYTMLGTGWLIGSSVVLDLAHDDNQNEQPI